MLLFPTKNEQLWEELWLSAIKKEDKKDSSKESEQNKNKQNNADAVKDDPIKRWDRMAGGFAKRSGSPEALKRKEKILSMLKEAGALKESAKILDIGAGPGNWTIPMAEAGAVVTALEPSGEMINELKRRIEKNRLDQKKMSSQIDLSNQIDIVQKTWQEVNIETAFKDGLFKDKFDLVFASMTPGISNPETLLKAMKAAKSGGFCYLSSFSGGGWRNAYKQIWKELFDEDIESHGGDFIYPFNYIYALGYRPLVEFNIWEHERAESIQDSLETILFFVHGSSDIKSEKKAKLIKYIESKAEDGIFKYKHQICQGVMLWQV
ncbi:MAG: class I SAM-dependent methyltransferase [Desulfamplus sp.]|nr:class I SAM-dependent methyltransferase [Desulfamplus sp.]